MRALALTFCSLVVAAPTAAQTPDSIVRLRIDTELGEMIAELYPARAPVTVANFLRYADAHRYDGGSFVRTVHAGNQPDDAVRIAVIQGVLHPWYMLQGGNRAIELERTRDTGLSHVDGALSMARGAPDSATHSFFICIGDQPELDFGGRRNADGQGFAVFGRIVSGMDVARRVQAAPAQGQVLTPPVLIRRIERLR